MKSDFIKSLGAYTRPETGEMLETEFGKTRVQRVIPYEEVVGEMRNNGVSPEEIGGFNLRVKHFLGDKRKYFECEIAYPDGEVGRIDWSEYLSMKNKKKG